MKRRAGIHINDAIARALTEALSAWITDENAIRRIVTAVSQAKPKPK